MGSGIAMSSNAVGPEYARMDVVECRYAVKKNRVESRWLGAI
ncbi:MAG: hypothetical protein RLZZ262_1985 [Bacteroidota bacterium]|jgi:hypothetical protein